MKALGDRIALTVKVRRAEPGMKMARVYRIRFTASSMTIPRTWGSGTEPEGRFVFGLGHAF